MEDRVDRKTEQELRGYLSARLNQIPVHSAPTFNRQRSGWFRSAAAVPLTMLLVVAAIASGVALGDWREQRAKESRVAEAGITGPLALAGSSPSAGFGLLSTSANTLVIRSEDRENALRVIRSALPQVAVAPNGKDVAFWLAIADAKTGATVYELHIADVIDAGGTAPPGGIHQVTVGLTYLTATDEMPFALRWSSDGTGLIVGTRTPGRRGPGAPPTEHTTWFAIDIGTRKVDRLTALDQNNAAITVYAWDRQRDLITLAGVDAGGQQAWIALNAGRISRWAIPAGFSVSAADPAGRSLVLVSRGTCATNGGVPLADRSSCPVFEIREQATFATLFSFSPFTTPVDNDPEVMFRPRSQDLIVQLVQPNGDARVELWSDLGRGQHRVLASYTQSVRFTGRRELILPRADGSAVFLLKFDDSAGGRWFGGLVGLSDASQTPFEIRAGGNPLASIVLDPAFATALSGKVTAPNTKGPPAAAPTPGGTPSRCADGRPQSEINAAGLLPHEPRSPLLECVLIAEGTSRVYRLSDGRRLQVFEYVGGLPVKPTAAPLQTGTRMIGSQSWSWMTVNGQTVLSTTLPDRVYVELDLPTSSNVSADLDTLQSIASTLRASSSDCGSARLSNASSTYDQAMLDCVWAAYTRGETARVSITMVTTEGDPVPTTLLAVPGGRSVVTRDLTADHFTNPAERVVSTYSCTTLTRRPWATDPGRYAFDLSDCRGPRATISFP